MRRWINGILLAVLGAILLHGAMKYLQGPKFEVGQRWTLEVDERYEDVSGLIVKIDPDPDFGEVIFIDIEGLRDIDGRPASLMFVPVSRRALRRSVVRFVEKTEEEPFYIESFYDNWRVRRTGSDRAVWTRVCPERLVTKGIHRRGIDHGVVQVHPADLSCRWFRARSQQQRRAT